MKNIRCISLFYVLLFLTLISQAQETALYKKLKALKDVVEITPLKYADPFKEKYVLKVKQWLDPQDTTVGFFTQRVFISHFDDTSPTVMVTEGYGGGYAERKEYTEELTRLFKTNQVFIEHRYFSSSTPENPDWKYLTTTNAAADHHKVRTMLKNIYTGKWIATGISKGGETALIYRTLYPNDVDITVCYVAPLAFGVEDGRHEPFIANQVSTAEDRAKVQDFQIRVLKNRKKIMPMFEKFCNDNKFTFNIPLDEVYDYCVLEFSFSFWQWGYKPASIPGSKATNADLFTYLVKVCSPDYFANEGIKPTQAFFIQAAKELGYYGYDTKPFAKYLKIKSAQGYLQKIFLPSGYNVAFDKTISSKCQDYISTSDPQMIFVYGEFDPWSAAAVNFSEKKVMYKAVAPGGSHASRISSLSPEVKAEVIKRITDWLAK
jgi:hypothetical protein